MVHLRTQCAKGSRGELPVRACRWPAVSRTKQGISTRGAGERRRARLRRGGPATALISNNEEENDDESCILAGGRYVSGFGKLRDRGGYHQNRICQYVQRPHRRDRQRYAQLVRARARSSRAQDGRQAGRGDL